MATRSIVGYETADGGYVGVYCYYDGYPEHMGPALSRMYHADVVIMVNQALVGGGIRYVNNVGDYEILDGGSIAATVKWPNCEQSYAYHKRLDGRVEWTRDGKSVQDWENELVSQR